MPPAPYPPLCGPAAHAKGVANNLMASFVAMGPTPAPTPTPTAPGLRPGERTRSASAGAAEHPESVREDPGGSGRGHGRGRGRGETDAGFGRVLGAAGFAEWLSGAAGTRKGGCCP